MTYDRKSIALLRYPATPENPNPGGYATGFFVDTEQYGEVCITCAHVFDPDHHPGPDRTKILINGHEATLTFDAFERHGVDIAVIKLPTGFATQGLRFHQLGVSQDAGRAFYAHAWSPTVPNGDQLAFTKIWGARTELLDQLDTKANPKIAITYKAWILRNDVYRAPAVFDPTRFHRGWSGAPVFNVRQRLDDHAVVGVLSYVATVDDAELRRNAAAVSVESLAFLQPKHLQGREARPIRRRPGMLRALVKSFTAAPDEDHYILGYNETADDTASLASITHARFQETTGQPVCPRVPEPTSPYDARR